jgi:hypothetical protein
MPTTNPQDRIEQLRRTPGHVLFGLSRKRCEAIYDFIAGSFNDGVEHARRGWA